MEPEEVFYPTVLLTQRVWPIPGAVTEPSTTLLFRIGPAVPFPAIPENADGIDGWTASINLSSHLDLSY